MGNDLGISRISSRTVGATTQIYASEKIRSEWKNMNSKGDESDLSVNKNIHRDLFILVYYITNVDNK